jgi:hypothetical protein
MLDYLGAIPFARIDFVPSPLDRQFQIASHAGVDGVTIWDAGVRADPVTIRCVGYAATYNLARAAVDAVKALQNAAPVAVTISGLAATGVLYQVTKVAPVECKRLVFGRGPGGFYYGRLTLEVTLQPVSSV